MAQFVFGNHSSVIVPRRDRESIRKFYCEVLGGVQAPGGQCLRLVGIDEDLSSYEGAKQGPDLGKWKAAFENGV